MEERSACSGSRMPLTGRRSDMPRSEDGGFVENLSKICLRTVVLLDDITSGGYNAFKIMPLFLQAQEQEN